MAIELSIPAGGVDCVKLTQELLAAGVPLENVSPTGVGAVSVTGTGKLQIGVGESYRTLCETVLFAHVRPPYRRRRQALAIYQDLNALSQSEKQRVVLAAVALLAVDHPGFLAKLGLAIAEDEPAE